VFRTRVPSSTSRQPVLAAFVVNLSRPRGDSPQDRRVHEQPEITQPFQGFELVNRTTMRSPDSVLVWNIGVFHSRPPLT